MSLNNANEARTSRAQYVLGDLLYLAFAVVVAVSVANREFAARDGALSAAGIAVVIRLVVPRTSSNSDKRISFWPVVLPIAFALWTWTSYWWSEIPSLSWHLGKVQVAMAIFFIAARVVIFNLRALILVGIGYVLGCLRLLAELFAENPLARTALINVDANRYTVFGLNQNNFAYTMVSGIAVCCLLATTARRTMVLWLSVGLALGIGVMLTGTRGAIYSTLMIMAWQLFSAPRVRSFKIFRMRRTAFRIMVAGLVIFGLSLLTPLVDRYLHQMFQYSPGRESGNLNGRLLVWPIARRLFYQHPFIGDGAGAITDFSPQGIFAHNALLDVGSGLGLVGIVLFLALLWSTIFLSNARASDHLRRNLAGVALCAIAPVLLTGYWLSAAPFWVLLAIFSRVATIEIGRNPPRLVKVKSISKLAAPTARDAQKINTRSLPT